MSAAAPRFATAAAPRFKALLPAMRGGDEELFWRIVEDHPLCRHQQAYADFSATRLSDVVSHRSLVNSRVYAEWFRPAGIAAELEAGIARCVKTGDPVGGGVECRLQAPATA